MTMIHGEYMAALMSILSNSSFNHKCTVSSGVLFLKPKLILDRPNKQCGLDALPTSLLKHCSCVLTPIIKGKEKVKLAHLI